MNLREFSGLEELHKKTRGSFGLKLVVTHGQNQKSANQ